MNRDAGPFPGQAIRFPCVRIEVADNDIEFRAERVERDWKALESLRGFVRVIRSAEKNQGSLDLSVSCSKRAPGRIEVIPQREVLGPQEQLAVCGDPATVA